MASALTISSKVKRFWQGGKFVPARHDHGRIWAPTDFRTHVPTFMACLLGGMGYSTDLICARTGLTPSQVGYRLHKYNVMRKDYRSGESALAKHIIKTASANAAPLMQRALAQAANAPKKLLS